MRRNSLVCWVIGHPLKFDVGLVKFQIEFRVDNTEGLIKREMLTALTVTCPELSVTYAHAWSKRVLHHLKATSA
jgi:hypothetical protein